MSDAVLATGLRTPSVSADLGIDPDLRRPPPVAPPAAPKNYYDQSAAEMAKQERPAPAITPSPSADQTTGIAPDGSGASPDEGAQRFSHYVKTTQALEGLGADPRSAAVGGFMPQTWITTMRSHAPELAGQPDSQILALRGDPSWNSKAIAWHAADNSTALQQHGVAVNEANLRLAHWLGVGGATKVLSAPPDTPASALFDKVVFDQNPNMRGKSARELVNMAGAQISTGRDLHEEAHGPFNAVAQPMLAKWQTEYEKALKGLNDAPGKSKDFQDAARSEIARVRLEADRPPANMHEAWNQWSGVAGAFALLGGLVGRNHTAAINAAGEMLQAANSADANAYDKAYTQWKDHLDRGMKIAEFMEKDARQVIEEARGNYDRIVTGLSTLSTFYQLNQNLDPKMIEQKNLEREGRLAELIQTRDERDAKKAATGALDRRAAANDPNMSPEDRAIVHNRNMYDVDHPVIKQATPITIKITDAAGNPVFNESAYLGTDGKYYRAGTTEPVPRTEGDHLEVVKGVPPKGPEAEVERETKRLDDAWAADPKNANATRADKEEAHHKNDLASRTEMALATSRSPSGKLSEDQTKLLAQQYIMGDVSVITSLPRTGTARIQLENEIGAQMKNIPDAARQIMMNRMRMVEARSAATTAGRVTMNTEVFSTEAVGAGHQVVETSKLFPRSDYPPINAALAAFDRGTGDPNVVSFGAALNSFVNVYGKMSNPTGTGIHEADKDRIVSILDKALSQGQIEAGVEQIIKEGRIVSSAAQEAQEAVLGRVIPQAPVGQTAPSGRPPFTNSPSASSPAPPPAAVAHLRGDTDPKARENFDKIFGAGAADRAMGSQ